MVREHCGEYLFLWTTIESGAPKIGCVPQTRYDWVKKHEVNAGMRDGISPPFACPVIGLRLWRGLRDSHSQCARQFV